MDETTAELAETHWYWDGSYEEIYTDGLHVKYDIDGGILEMYFEI